MDRMKPRVLVVDDDAALAEMLTIVLRGEGFEPFHVADGTQALTAVREVRPDLVLLDLMLPGMNGIDVCRVLRQDSGVPIVMLTAKGEEVDRIVGLEMGADDYLPKPFALEELLARLRALLRRTGPEDSAESAMMSFGDLTLDPATREVHRGKRSISLTRTEFALLEMLMANPRRVLTRSRILEEVWGFDFPTSGNALEVYVGYLRRKTEAEGETRLIHTVRGVGYVLRETPP